LPSNAESVAATTEFLAADSPAEESPTQPESLQPCSSSVPSSDTVQQPVLDVAAEVTATEVTLPESPQTGDELVQQITLEVAEQNSVHDVTLSASAENVQVPEPVIQTEEPVIPTPTEIRQPTGTALLDLKRQRARERQERMLLRSANGNSALVMSARSNGTVVNGVDGTSPYAVTDNTAFVGTKHKYLNRYEITASDDKEKCCIVM